ncbi:MAG: MlaD family protein [Gemmatimonadota bacterium]|nr:MlaD family protein [Gemmatimonadota bacterium]
MSSERRKNDFVVGLTVLVVSSLVIATVLWLKQASFRSASRPLAVRSRDVGGLALGNPVVVRGVRAGKIDAIELGDSGWVNVTLGVDRNVSLPRDPVVLLFASSLFGEWQATIADAAALPADAELRAHIAEARTSHDTLAGAVLPDIAQLTTVAGRIAGDVATVSERVQVAFDDKAAGELRLSIRNFAQLSGELATTVRKQSRNLDSLSSSANVGVSKILSAAATIDKIAARVDSSTSEDQLRQIVTNTRNAARELVAATTRLRMISDSASTTQSKLHSVMAQADSLLAKVNGRRGSLGLLVNDSKLYHNTDSLIVELRALVADVKKNPKKYVNVKVF